MFTQINDNDLNAANGGRKLGWNRLPTNHKPSRNRPNMRPGDHITPAGHFRPASPQSNSGMSTGKKAGIGAGAAIITAAATAGILKAEDVI